MEQEQFQKYYPLYSKVLQSTGLMPFDTSVLAFIKRTVFIVLLFCCIYVQAKNLQVVDKTLANIIWMLSYTWALILFVLRYCSFVKYKKLTRKIFCDIGNDIDSTTDPVEIEIFNKQTEKAQLLVLAYMAIASFLAIYTAIVLLLPTLLRAGWQLRAVRLYGYIYKEHSLQVDLVCIMLTAVSVMGIFAIVGTESTLAIYGTYFCGLFEISSYRICLAIQNAENADSSVLIKVRSSLDLQRKAFDSLYKLQRQQTVPYLLAIGAVIISFAVTLFRDLVFAVGSLLLHFSVMFFNNYCGQIVKESGTSIYDTIVQSAWYKIPTRSQKTLLFVMLRSIQDVECNLAGLYKLSFEGFAIMMNSSFSYFTLLCSTQ